MGQSAQGACINQKHLQTGRLSAQMASNGSQTPRAETLEKFRVGTVNCPLTIRKTQRAQGKRSPSSHTLWLVVRERVIRQCHDHCRSCSRSQVIKAVSEEDTEQQGADSLALGDATSLCTIMASAAFRFTKAGALKHAVTRAQQCKLRVLG